MMYKKSSLTSFDDKYMNSYPMTIVMIVLSFTVYKTFANKMICEKFDIEEEDQVHQSEEK